MTIAKRVCHLSTVHSGVEIRIARKELATLAAAGYEAHLIISASAEEVAEASSMGIELHTLGTVGDSSRMARMTVRMAHAYKLARKVSADLYHFHDPELIPLGLALKLSGKKVVMDVHEDLASQILIKHWIRPLARKTVARTARGFERFGAGRFDAVVVAYPFVGTLFEDKAPRVAVIRNFPFLQELCTDAPEEPWSMRTKVAYVGGISRIRGIREIVKAVGIAKVRMELAGLFMTQEERDEVLPEPGWAWVDERGWVGRSGIQSAMRKSFAGLCTLYPTLNHIHTEPIKMFEYMAAGIPVVASNIAGWRHFVEDSGSGICVDPKDPQAIAQAIIYLRDHPQEAEQMGKNGRNAVLQKYNWNQEASKLTALYRDLLG